MNDYRAEIDRLRAELAAARQLNRDWEESFDAARFEQMSDDLAAARRERDNAIEGMDRVLAIIDRKIAEGGGIFSGTLAAIERHNAHHRARLSAFSECATILRGALSLGGTP